MKMFSTKLVVVLCALVVSTFAQRSVKFTYYWCAFEPDYPSGTRSASIKACDNKNNVIAKTTEKYAKDLKLECSGRLNDGRFVNGGNDDCTCFNVVSGPKGSNNNDLIPFVSIAANDIKYGTKCYVAQLDGLVLPSGETHNGCVRVDDVSWSFGKNHIDFYVYRKKYYEQLMSKIDGSATITCPSTCTLKSYKY